MKKWNPCKRFLAASALIGLLYSCGSEETGLVVTQIRVETASVVQIGSSLEFKAFNQDNADITSVTDFYVNDRFNPTNEYAATNIGTLAITGKYEDVTSAITNVEVIASNSSLELSASKTTLKPNLKDAIDLTVTNQDGFNVTSLVELYVNDALYASSSFTTDAYQSFDILARDGSTVSNTITVEAVLEITSLSLSVKREYNASSGVTEIQLYAIDQESDTVNRFVDFFVDDQLMDSNVLTTSEKSTVTFYARFKDVQSNTVSVNLDAKPVRKALIEEFTGEWCGWCPQAGYNIRLLLESNPNILAVAIHNGDVLEYANEELIRDVFFIHAFPSAIYNRVKVNGAINAHLLTDPGFTPIQEELDRQLSEEAKVGIAMHSSVDGNNDAIINVSLNFFDDITGELYITVYLHENNVKGRLQQNYFSGHSNYTQSPFYSQPPQITGFVHNHVLRRAGTSVYGDKLPSGAATKGNIYTPSTFSFPMQKYDVDQSYVIAFVHYSTDGENNYILNAQQVKVGSSIDYFE